LSVWEIFDGAFLVEEENAGGALRAEMQPRMRVEKDWDSRSLWFSEWDVEKCDDPGGLVMTATVGVSPRSNLVFLSIFIAD
jgi:hypothetical protein